MKLQKKRERVSFFGPLQSIAEDVKVKRLYDQSNFYVFMKTI